MILIFGGAYNGKLKFVKSEFDIKENIEKLKGKIIICDEISAGIVPLEKKDRVWREDTGKTLQYISKHSDKVFRVFLGYETRIK